MTTPEALILAAAAALSLVFKLFPPARRWYEALDSDWKQAVMGYTVIAAAVVIQAVAYQQDPASLTLEGLLRLVGVIVAALGANQGVYQLFVKEKKADG